MDTSQKGLTDQEALARLKKYGKNVLAEKTRFIFLKELFQSFFSPLILLLLAASFVSAILGDVTDFLIILFIVILSGGISFLQHYRAESASKRLKSKVILTATVIREGQQREIPFSHVTIGDIVLLSVGDLVPADMQLIETREVSIDESTLTGESFPAEKKSKVENTDTHKTTAYAGTHVVTGEAKGVVVAIGKQTQLGQLSEKIVEEKPKTAFDKELASFSTLVIRLILVLALFVFGVNAFFHHNILSSFLFAIALAVGLTPELMPVIITISLSKGALKMEKKEVIVKFLPSIQNLGGMDILCMDKTGTITENNIILSSYEDADGRKNETLLLLGKINSHFQSGFKNPLDHALLASTTHIGVADYTKIDEVPFDFERKKLSVIVKFRDSYEMITKGAPDKILEIITHYQSGQKKIKLTPQKLHALKKRTEELARSGLRVIALAKKSVVRKKEYFPKDEDGLTFLGFLIFSDPIKSTVSETLKTLTSLGIQTKILTGDNILIAEKTCRDAGISIDSILTGADLNIMHDSALSEKLDTTTLFASLTPEQKARIITLYRKQKHIVGFLGDGINDAPPLKAADIGISVNNGSDVAKDVADVILMKKSLSVLADGVTEGRVTYANTFKYIMMSLSSNFGNMMSVAIASLFIPFLPLLPVQIILMDFLYDVSQIAIPSDNVDRYTVTRPQSWSIGLLRKFMLIFGPLSSIFDLITFSVLLYFLHASIPVFQTGWFVESFITQTLIIFAIRTSLVPFFRSRPSPFLFMSCAIALVTGAFLVFTPFGRYFSFTHLPAVFWIILVVEVVGYFIFVELTKLWFYKKINLNRVEK